MRAVWVAAGVLVAGMVVWALWPSTGPAGSKAGKSCMSNLKVIGQAVSIYSEDMGGLPSPAKWNDALKDYAKSMDSFRCPSAKQFGYAWNSELKPEPKEKIANPATTAIVFDSPILAKNASDSPVNLPNPPRHDGKNQVLFADGHAGLAP